MAQKCKATIAVIGIDIGKHCSPRSAGGPAEWSSAIQQAWRALLIR